MNRDTATDTPTGSANGAPLESPPGSTGRAPTIERVTMTETDEREPYLLSTWLKEHQRGTLDLELGELLRALIGEVGRLDKKGTITLTVIAEKQSDSGINIAGEVTSKLPKDAPVPSFYFVADDDTPTRRDPQQPFRPTTHVDDGPILDSQKD